MNDFQPRERTRSNTPKQTPSTFKEHLGLVPIVVPRAVGRVILVGAGVGAAVGAIYAGSKGINAIAPENPGLSARQAALGDIDAQDGPIVIDAGSNYRSTDAFDVPNDQGGGPNNILGQLKENIVVPKPMEASDGWDAVELPGTNTINAKTTVWFNVQDLIAQKMAHYLPQSGLPPTYGEIEVNPSGSVSRMEANGSVVPDPGVGLSHNQSH
jgi:hypothetical protein